MAKYRIIMKRGTVIEAEHVSLLNPNSAIYMVGIGTGNGPTQTRRIHVPGPNGCFDQFYHPIAHTKRGKSSRGMDDPSHSDYLVTPKFQRVITMHAKNMRSINGKPVYDTSDVDSGLKHLDFDESWSIDNISDILED